ncbi:patatin-like phospholipase family protein [Alkalicaulis satelles]|uniref:Patatin-like phospholipase family protein n=1 Tax=Alkalicaulis satelles TaxID=2609175 RepID=A0A5M6ZMN9_9PROT|nr:patatin-like phospholipase family protein [Alkalicaulis satelles]KAA5804957.1 patatin-like phospholipase family protein [Alkalicaulis satelles]
MTSPSPAPRPVSLALQGGGAHGAFTWGVLDRLLEDGRIEPRAITATSAGAMNACALAMGRTQGGADGARQALERFWDAVSRAGAPFRAPGWGRFFPWIDAFTRLTSPYDLNPFGYDPLGDILKRQIDFEAVRACPDLKLYLCATCVITGRARVFSGDEVTLDAVRASAALPFLHHAVEIDGAPYWDGGFTGNPALWPLFYQDTPADLLIVHINPLDRPGTPRSAEEIMDRVNEITFNTSLLAELRAIAFVQELLGTGAVTGEQRKRLRAINVHSIKADEALKAWPASTKYDTSWSFLTRLRDLGRETASHWLNQCSDAVGKRSSVDLKAEYLQG